VILDKLVDISRNLLVCGADEQGIWIVMFPVVYCFDISKLFNHHSADLVEQAEVFRHHADEFVVVLELLLLGNRNAILEFVFDPLDFELYETALDLQFDCALFSIEFTLFAGFFS